MIAASVLGAWLGAGIVAACRGDRCRSAWGARCWPRRLFFAMTNLGLFPAGGNTLGLTPRAAGGRASPETSSSAR